MTESKAGLAARSGTWVQVDPPTGLQGDARQSGYCRREAYEPEAPGPGSEPTRAPESDDH